ncbi:MAG: FAD-dependent oxidoreductase [Gemmatimonadota bacterium]
MHRDLDQLEDRRFDLLVIGGGIHGAAVAWDAVLRGLSVALVEQNDFCSGTTGNSLRVVHGGLRALQNGDLAGLRRSAREQAILLHIAQGHLRPLPCLIPIIRGMNPGASAFQTAFSVMRLATADLDRGSRRSLPRARVLSRNETIQRFDGFEPKSLTGGALWFDAQVPDMERLVLAFLRSAASRGAAIANYVRVERLVGDSVRVQGAEALDMQTGRYLRINAGAVVNAAGPWDAHIPAHRSRNTPSSLPTRWARGVNVIVNQQIPDLAIGVRSPWGAERDPVSGGNRFLFLTQWHGNTLAGTSYTPLSDRRPDLPLSAQLARLIDELNDACPSLRWSSHDIVNWHSGKLPLRAGFQSGPPGQLIDRGTVVNHAVNGHRGLISIVGAKFTTARLLAERAVDLAIREMGRRNQPCLTAQTPLDPEPERPQDLVSRVRWAIENEMALSLEDIATRRLGIGLARFPRPDEVRRMAEAAGPFLGWNPARMEREIGQVLSRFAFPAKTQAA